MPSVTDLQQQSSKISSNNNGKLTPPPQQQQQIISTSTGNTTDTTHADAITQVILMLEKKQRNLGKRKEKLESYEEEAKSGKELNKDQKEALAKYAEVLGQIECVKDISEQIKKIQTESAKNQKRLVKQATDEKRLLVAQRLREYAQLRYLLEHQPSSLKPEESSLLDELARVIVPCDAALNVITRSIDAVLSIYQGGSLSSTIKNITGRTSQELRETLEQLIKQCEISSSMDTSTIQQTQLGETVKQTPVVVTVAVESSSIPSVSVLPQREPNKQQQSNDNTDVLESSLSHTHLIQTNSNKYSTQFDTRKENIPLQSIIADSTFLFDSIMTNVTQDSSNNQDNSQIQTNDSKQILQTFTIVNSNLSGQTSSQGYTQTNQQQGNNYDQETTSNVIGSNNVTINEQQTEEKWQHPRGNSGNAQRIGQYNGNHNKNYHRGGQINYNQQNWRGPRGRGHYDGSYAGGQRYYNENGNRGGGGHRVGSNPNYRGNRGGNQRGGGGGGGNSGYHGNANQKSTQFHQNTDQQEQQEQ
ncbi:unnamed protein product [Rotaria magnacalcarata]|uniref:Caprin-1 dimerization domain-containing protein n=1 Tax=Rotaria magnacalcarata TaxID=392030 RepID=A0A819H3M3_9BILA|nr:unnamed protein product [Rotaria magnacalcarata]CAF1468787.1 unnamed protein product [Rotaria magnacalcarata]CAF1929592.1 unnamed protein product [Rotaria magnacalcarata]CAF1991144.1 unnamed protein product [Rotaria magnacalcarata]CAF2104829.1 unnamed protein product [Rotaria magnacalcarata]